MIPDESKPFFNPPIAAFLLLFGIIFSTYLNSFHAPWQMDDKANIVINKALHIPNLMPWNLWDTFFASPLHLHKLYRPLPCFSFALNWYFGGVDTFGYHVVNFGFHFATALILYFLFFRLLLVINGPVHLIGKSYIHSAALFAAAMWAINPIQTQAVTYIVQRMAVMAAFFSVLSILYYIKSRTAENQRQQCFYATLCGLWFLCALGSKENAVMLPFSLIMTEWIFFQKGRFDYLRHPRIWVAAVGLGAAALIGIFIRTNGAPLEYIQKWFHYRPFTLEERLLSQPRIVLGYLSQIFYPSVEGLSIAHDVEVSTSLFTPWTTLPAMGIIIGLMTWAILKARHYPFAAFAILFFFLNHLVESSILPLELIFEHRNYLPSIFLFLPISVWLQRFLIRMKQSSRLIYGIMVAVIIIMMVGVGLSTYTRNADWETEIKLWTDAARKAPDSIRPLVTLGIQYGWKKNPSFADYRYALALFQRSLSLPQTARKSEKAEILGNMASIYFHQGMFEKAISTYYEALDLDSSFLKNRSDLVKPLIIAGRFEEAEQHAKFLVNKRPGNANDLSMLGFILLWRDKPNDAIIYFHRALAKGLRSGSLFSNIGITLTRLESFENGQWFLQRAAQESPRDPLPLLGLIENRSRAKDLAGADMYAKRVILRFPIASIISRLDDLQKDHRSTPVSADQVKPFIRKALKQALNKPDASI